MKEDYYFTWATREAAKSPERCKHGAIIVKGGKIVGRGFNHHGLHAEDSALRDFSLHRFREKD